MLDKFERINKLSEEEKKYLNQLLDIVPNINGIEDLLGQDKDGVIVPPTKMFKKNLKQFGRLLDNDPNKVTSAFSIWVRKTFIHNIALSTCPNDLSGKTHHMVKEAEIPTDRPLIFMPNHISRDDASASIIAAQVQAYFVFGSLPLFFQTKNGVGAWQNGCFLVNRKNKESKTALNEKILYGFKKGLPGVIFYPEGSLNKTQNKLLLDYWRGVFILAKKSNALVVPIVHLEVGGDIYSSRLEAIDFKDWEMEQTGEAMAYLRDMAATELYELMEKYAHTTREDILLNALEAHKGITRDDIQKLEETHPHLTRKQIIEKFITMDEVCELAIQDLLEPIGEYYDYDIETSAHYQPKNIVEPWDVWEPIINISKVSPEDNQILKLIPTNYQKKY